ncbi:hypothetical protein P879_06248 [Paragonimus westermani]|uniref:Uncharacterized protein n=1 Tax=Paragonimus westermani TaxID=34504 RepID=A0A8T0DK01_9TREM|nr:hypothetical protein P879_06248 [Paragonimus westermani]
MYNKPDKPRGLCSTLNPRIAAAAESRPSTSSLNCELKLDDMLLLKPDKTEDKCGGAVLETSLILPIGDFSTSELNFPAISHMGFENSVAARFSCLTETLGSIEYVSSSPRWLHGHTPSSLDCGLASEDQLADDLEAFASLRLSKHAVTLFDYTCSTKLVSYATIHCRIYRKIDAGTAFLPGGLSSGQI